MSIVYLNPEGVVISKKEAYDTILENPHSYLIEEYSNGKVEIQLLHAMTVTEANVAPREFWKMFYVSIRNTVTHDSEGVPYTEPRTTLDPDSRGFRTLEEARGYYQHFLAKYTESYFDESGELVQEGNILAPPNLDLPTVSESSFANSEMGSW